MSTLIGVFGRLRSQAQPETVEQSAPSTQLPYEGAAFTVTATAVPEIEAKSSSPKGLVPSTTSAANAAATTTASSQERPSSDQ